MHCMHANYQTFVWKNSHVPYVVVPSPIGSGWKYDHEGAIAIDWIEGTVMPQQLVDILESVDNERDKIDEIEGQGGG